MKWRKKATCRTGKCTWVSSAYARYWLCYWQDNASEYPSFYNKVNVIKLLLDYAILSLRGVLNSYLSTFLSSQSHCLVLNGYPSRIPYLTWQVPCHINLHCDSGIDNYLWTLPQQCQVATRKSVKPRWRGQKIQARAGDNRRRDEGLDFDKILAAISIVRAGVWSELVTGGGEKTQLSAKQNHWGCKGQSITDWDGVDAVGNLETQEAQPIQSQHAQQDQCQPYQWYINLRNVIRRQQLVCILRVQ